MLYSCTTGTDTLLIQRAVQLYLLRSNVPLGSRSILNRLRTSVRVPTGCTAVECIHSRYSIEYRYRIPGAGLLPAWLQCVIHVPRRRTVTGTAPEWNNVVHCLPSQTGTITQPRTSPRSGLSCCSARSCMVAARAAACAPPSSLECVGDPTPHAAAGSIPEA
jgi:hypothetical protein